MQRDKKPVTSSTESSQLARRSSLADFIATQMSQDYPDTDAAATKGGSNSRGEHWRQK